MSWNYRVTKDNDEYAIREVYYHESGEVQGWTENPVSLTGETPEDIRDDLMLIVADAFTKHVLDITER